MTRSSGTVPIQDCGVPWPSRPRRDASSHHVVGKAYAIGWRTDGRWSIWKIAPESRYRAPAIASGYDHASWRSCRHQPAMKMPMAMTARTPSTVAGTR